MTELEVSFVEPFSSPAWGSNFIVFTGSEAFTVPESMTKSYLNRAAKYARHHGVHLVPERFMLAGYLCLCLISPDGNILGAQKAAYISRDEKNAKRSSRVEVFNTVFGCIFLCAGADVYHPEACRIAAGMGAEIMVSSQQIAKRDYDSHLVVTGPWNASQLGNMYVLSAMGFYNCVCAPVPLSPRGDGFIAPPNTKLPLTARIHVEKLGVIKRGRGLSRKFYAIHREELLR